MTPHHLDQIAEWNPILGCSPISIGCANCHNMRVAANVSTVADLTSSGGRGAVWTGELRWNEAWFDYPEKLTAPRVIHVCSHGDLFHENAPVEWIDKVFGLMERNTRHVFQVLTKRAARLAEYLNRRYRSHAPSHLWFSVSSERQIEANERIPHLLLARASVRYITCYPLLGPIDLRPFLAAGRIKYVVAGSEVARPMQPEWEADLRRACEEHSVPYGFGALLEREFVQG